MSDRRPTINDLRHVDERDGVVAFCVTGWSKHLSLESPNPKSSGAAPDDELTHWVRIAIDAAADKLGQDTQAFFVGEVMAITDWFVITSGRTNRQVRAIVDAVEEALTKAGGPKPNRVEGRDTMSWVLMDYGAIVVHVFTAESRQYYELERLWRDVPTLGPSAERPQSA